MPFDSPAFASDTGLLLSIVRERGLPPPGESGWMAEASLYRLGMSKSQVKNIVLRQVFEMRLWDPGSGMGCLFMRTYTNTADDMDKLLTVMPAARRLFDTDELEQILTDPVKRAEVVEALKGFARLGGDLTEGERAEVAVIRGMVSTSDERGK